MPQLGEDGSVAMTADSGIVFVLIPGGTFTMGAQKSDPSGPNFDDLAVDNETPHEVDLDPYFLARHELTQGQWLRLSGEEVGDFKAGARMPGGEWITGSHPAERVDWTMCDELLRRCGLVLPTEAQWERACRAGGASPWHCGDEVGELAGCANLSDATAEKWTIGWRNYEDFEDGHVIHAPVGSYRPNAFGLYDMHGNVGEWCRDWNAGYEYSAAPGDGLRQHVGRNRKVVRGGSYRGPAEHARTAFRGNSNLDQQASYLGLRAARPVVPPGR